MAYLIDGNTELINFGNYSAINDLTDMSWSLWIKRESDGGGGYQRIVNKRNGGVVGWVVWRENGTQFAFYDYRWSGTTPKFYWPEIALSTWVHMVFTYSGSDMANKPVVYYDGVSQTVVVNQLPGGTHTNSEARDLVLGNRTNSTQTRQLDGEMAEFGMWNRILSASEAAELAAGYTPDHILNGLVLYSDLVRDANNRVEGNAGTVTGATVSVHPRVIRTTAQILQLPPAAAGATELIPPPSLHSFATQRAANY